MNPSNKINAIAGVALAILAAAALIECDRQAAGRRIQSSGSAFTSPCGSSLEVSARVGKCLEPIFELVEGKFDEVKGDASIVHHCQRFNSTDRCVKSIAKDCLTGIHKTAVSAVSSAIKRFRVSECKSETSRAGYIEPLRCARDKTAKRMATLFRDYTSIMQTARDMPILPEQKLTKVCCALNAIDKEVEKTYNSACPEHTAAVISIVHAITDDARNTLCISPKCQGVLTSIQPTRLKQQQNFIEPVMQILFQLSD